MKKIYSLLALFIISSSTLADTMFKDMTQGHTLYVVVSSLMPRNIIAGHVKEASQTGAVLVLNGFVSSENSFVDVQKFISQMNLECCEQRKQPRWIMNPVLVSHYKIKSTPAFLIAKSDNSLDENSYSIITGDMDMANVLKTFAQKSKSPQIRDFAIQTYNRAYAN